MNLAIAYGMKKKKMAHGGMCKHGSSDCEMCHGGEYAKGGDVSDTYSQRGVHTAPHNKTPGISFAGEDVRKAKKIRDGIPSRRDYEDDRSEESARHWEKGAKNLHKNVLREIRSMKHDRYAEGGEVEDHDDDIVSRIMHKRAGEPLADFEPNEFDEQEKEPAEKFSYTGENSGDELGNEHLEDDEHDMISRIMKSRKMKDRNPRPA